MYPTSFFPETNPFVRAGIGGVGHYGIMKLVAKFGSRVTDSPIHLTSYLLVHTIGTIFSECINKLAALLQKRLNASTDQFFIKKIAAGANYCIEKTDRVYTYLLGIRSLKETSALPDRFLSMGEVYRKVFWETVKNQFLFISSWEIGIRSAQFLLKRTITVLIPGTKWFYAANFILQFLFNVHMLRDNVFQEQREAIDIIFEEPKSLVKRKIIAFNTALQKESLNNQKSIQLPLTTSTIQNLVELNKQMDDLEVLTGEYQQIVKSFVKTWQHSDYKSTDTDLLKSHASIYKSICTQYRACKTVGQLNKFKVDLANYISPKNQGLIDKVCKFVVRFFYY